MDEFLKAHERKPFSKSAVLVYLYISVRGYTSYERMTRELHISPATLARAIKELTARGFFTSKTEVGTSKIEVEKTQHPREKLENHFKNCSTSPSLYKYKSNRRREYAKSPGGKGTIGTREVLFTGDI